MKRKQSVGKASKLKTTSLETESHPKKKRKSELTQHKEDLQQLEQTDPEFYKFLKENDKELLQFDDISSGESDGEDSIHHPPNKLEVASDDSEAEELSDDSEGKSRSKPQKCLSLAQIKQWEKDLKEPKPIQTLVEVIRALKAAVEQVEGSDSNKTEGLKVAGSAVFNSILRLCILDMVPTINRLLRARTEKDTPINFKPSSAKMWGKIQAPIKVYLTSFVKVLSAVAEPTIVRVLLKHTLQLVPYYATFPKISKALMKKLVHFWCTGEEAVRVLALMSIVRITRAIPDHLLQAVLKDMYLAYVKNSKFTSPSTWPLINFMKHSLVEVFALDHSLAYKHAFVYIRQLAIHLRNAITVKKKDMIKTVYNWQFIHCLYLWSQLLSTVHPSQILQPLIYPLVQTIIGTCKLVPTSKYIPLRYHCVRALTSLTRETGVFIPVMPLLLDGLDFVDLNKKHTRISWKPLDFLCVLKLSKSQLSENAFKDAVIDQFYELSMDFLSTQSHTLGFPELVLPVTLQLKAFCKKCRIATYNKQLKQLLDKIDENSRAIDSRRKSVSFSLADRTAVDSWQNQVKQEGSMPLAKYYTTYRKMRTQELVLGITKKGQLDSEQLPAVKRKELMEKHKAKDQKELGELFADDSDEDNEADLLTEAAAKAKRPAAEEDAASDSDATEGSGDDDDDDDDDDEPPQLVPIKKSAVEKVSVDAMSDSKDVVEELELSSSDDDEEEEEDDDDDEEEEEDDDDDGDDMDDSDDDTDDDED